jgi:hypothetical protein
MSTLWASEAKHDQSVRLPIGVRGGDGRRHARDIDRSLLLFRAEALADLADDAGDADRWVVDRPAVDELETGGDVVLEVLRALSSAEPSSHSQSA